VWKQQQFQEETPRILRPLSFFLFVNRVPEKPIYNSLLLILIIIIVSTAPKCNGESFLAALLLQPANRLGSSNKKQTCK
jgi:hypothetical protein